MKRITLLTLTLILSSNAWAGDGHHSINDRQMQQKHRIVQGVKSGELTRPEAKRLVHAEKRIAKKEAYFKSDGEFTLKERAIVQHDLNHTSHRIYTQKHDEQSRN